MYVSTKADQVWNRACERDATALRPGDRTLAALLVFHGYTMNGGILHALECLGQDELDDAERAYRYFGLDGLADLLSETKSISTSGADLDLWEAELDERYRAVVPCDSTLFARYESILRGSPSEFAPI